MYICLSGGKISSLEFCRLYRTPKPPPAHRLHSHTVTSSSTPASSAAAHPAGCLLNNWQFCGIFAVSVVWGAHLTPKLWPVLPSLFRIPPSKTPQPPPPRTQSGWWNRPVRLGQVKRGFHQILSEALSERGVKKSLGHWPTPPDAHDNTHTPPPMKNFQI